MQRVVAKHETAKEAFSRRLNAALNEVDGCPRARGRPAWLARAVTNEGGKKISAEGVRKWLSGEAVAEDDNLAVLARVARVEAAWLQHELGPKRKNADDALSTEMQSVWAGITDDRVREEVLDYAKYKAKGGGSKDIAPPFSAGQGSAKKL